MIEAGKYYLGTKNNEIVRCNYVSGKASGKIEANFTFMRYGSQFTDFNCCLEEYARLYTKGELDEMGANAHNV